MTAEEIVIRVVHAFDHLQVPYMLAGSFSSNHYGVPRSTQDADFVVHLEPHHLQLLAAELGEEFQLDRQISFETVTGTRRNVILHKEAAFKLELFRVSDDAHDRARFQRRVQRDIHGTLVWLPTAEDVVIWKLRWAIGGGRRKDRDDVFNVIAVQHHRLDWPYIHNWCDQHGTRALLDEIVASIPPDLLEESPSR